MQFENYLYKINYISKYVDCKVGSTNIHEILSWPKRP